MKRWNRQVVLHEPRIPFKVPTMIPKLGCFIDFDHTLFDTRAFLRAAASIATKYGVRRHTFHRTFEEITEGDSDRPYCFDRHVSAMRLTAASDKRRLLCDLEVLLDKARTFLFPDSIPFLRAIRKWNVGVGIVTFADHTMRSWQVNRCGFDNLVDNTHIFPGSRADKIHFVKSLCDKCSPLVLIDDHPQILFPLKRSPVLLIRVRRTIVRRYAGREPDMSGILTFRTLEQTYQYLEPILRSFWTR